MLADAERQVHRDYVRNVLAEPEPGALQELVARQQQIRIKCATVLPSPRFAPRAGMDGPYAVGLSAQELEQYGVRVVGGAVRDRLLSSTHSPDLDCVVAAEHWDAFLDHAQRAGYRPRVVPRAMACKLQAGPATGREFVATRSDCYAAAGRLLHAVAAPLTADPWRRDFTLQALYADPGSGDLWDPFGACERRQLELILPGALVEDPLRVLRLVRAQLTHDLPVEPDTEHEARAVARCTTLCATLESFRVQAELDRAARAGVLGPMLRTLEQWGWPGMRAADPAHDRLRMRSATQWMRRASLAL